MGSRDLAPAILKLDNRKRAASSSGRFTPGEKIQHHLYWKFSGCQGQPECSEKNSPDPTGNRAMAHRLVNIPTELPRNLNQSMRGIDHKQR